MNQVALYERNSEEIPVAVRDSSHAELSHCVVFDIGVSNVERILGIDALNAYKTRIHDDVIPYLNVGVGDIDTRVDGQPHDGKLYLFAGLEVAHAYVNLFLDKKMQVRRTQ